jgi:hypothetical protein
LAVGLFLALRADSAFWIWSLAALLPMARAVGVVCICPILVDQCLKRRPVRAAILGTGTLAGILAYLLVFKHITGDPFAGLRSTFDSTLASTDSLTHPLHFLRIFFA